MKFSKLFFAALLGCLVCGIITSIFWLSVVLGIAGSSSSSSVVTVEPNSVLKIDLSDAIVDTPQQNPLSGFDYQTFEVKKSLTTLSVLNSIAVATVDDNIKGIYLRLEGAGVTTAALEEIRSAIEEFKKSGKFVIAYNENYTQGHYYLASVADKVYLQPEGMVQWQGLAITSMFYKGLLDKLDITFDVFRPTVCKYKSAVEPYIYDKMTDANRAQMAQLTNSMWDVILNDVSKSRSLSVDQLNDIATNLTTMTAKGALESKMVDGLIYEDQMNDIFEELGVEVEDKTPNCISLSDYVSLKGNLVTDITADQVGVIYAEGSITDGEGLSAGTVFGNSTAATIRKARLDDDIKAVVLRVNSPGGSALASDVMWRELELLRAEKPLIVSMGGMAASGGYYISAPADVILADRLTLTGSIGVFAMAPNVKNALKNKLGVTLDVVKTNESAGFMTAPYGMSEFEKSVMLKNVDEVYGRFTSLVAEGRNLPIEKVLDIAQGRVWSGVDAVELGLADAIGGFHDAIELAASKANLDSGYRVKEVIDEPTGFAALVAELNVKVSSLISSKRTSPLESLINEYAEIYNALTPLTTENGMVMYSPYKVEL